NIGDFLEKAKNLSKEKNKKLKIIFMGTPDIAIPFLQHLIFFENVIGVFTAPDMPAGRHMKIRESSIKKMAKMYGLNVFQPYSLKDEKVTRTIKALKPDLIVVVAYGYIIPEEIINIPTYKVINIHFSLLPKYRGAAPINWALMNGEMETGVSSFFMTKKLDAGDIIYQKKIKIFDEYNSETLSAKLVYLGLEVLNETIGLIQNFNFVPQKQNQEEVSVAPKLKKIDGKVDWNSKNTDIYNRIRGLVKWPGSYSGIYSGEELKILKLFDPKLQYIEESGNIPGEILDICKERGLLIKCGHGAIWIQRIQLDGHKIIHGYDFFIGRKIQKGDILES
ncbi:MAG: methionyl-tRNA formyltransferase, partial [Elusimicrobiota bacterium]|nr:methionyl-tRNA formyltransferase [Elusimicrobiota bacterium]